MNELNLGIVGLDTSHAPAMTRLLNDSENEHHLAGARVTLAYAGGSPDIEASRTRLPRFRDEVESMGVTMVESLEYLASEVDGVLLTSVDGRVHASQAEPIIKAGTPLFIDKPMATSLKEVREIFHMAARNGVPCFSASSLRFLQQLQEFTATVDPHMIQGADVYAPCPTEPHHPDLMWYGIHGVELLLTILGPDWVSVHRHQTADTDVVVGTWRDGRTGVFRGSRTAHDGFGAFIHTDCGVRWVRRDDEVLYVNLVKEILTFFHTGIPPVCRYETESVFVFMEAAHLSGREHRTVVTPLESAAASAGS